MTTGRRITTAVVCAVASLSLLAGMAVAAPESGTASDQPPRGGDEQDPEPPEVEPVAEAELAALARAGDLVAARRRASGTAEYDRVEAEERAVEVHRERQAAVEDLERATSLLEEARDRYGESIDARRAAQAHFDDGVALSYKFGGTTSSALVMAALSSATDAHDLSRAMRELDGVLGHSYEDLLARLRAVEQARRRVDSLERLQAVAAEVVARTEAAVEPAEAAVDRARTSARLAEEAVLDALDVALDAEDAVDAAIEDAEPPADGRDDPAVLAELDDAVEAATEALADFEDPLGGSEEADGQGPSTDVRRGWVADRRAVAAAEARLGRAATVIRADLTCPVDGARFSNDFHYPRSHARRHLGTDVFGERGEDVVALREGTITAIDAVDHFDGGSDLGGISVSWTTDVGRFYAAHLERLAPGLAVGVEVEAGQALGTVGTSGNAAGTPPHLHLGWYVDDVAVNPYPSLALACDDRT